MIDSRHHWGCHLVIDFSGCPSNLLTDELHIRKWSSELVKSIGMKPHGKPIVEHFATDNPQAAGFTLVQLIETSNICAHFAENIGEAYIDIFSCKSIDEKQAVDVCQRYFEPVESEIRILLRGPRPVT